MARPNVRGTVEDAALAERVKALYRGQGWTAQAVAKERMVCGAPTTDEAGVYCAEHHALCWVPRQLRRFEDPEKGRRRYLLPTDPADAAPVLAAKRARAA